MKIFIKIPRIKGEDFIYEIIRMRVGDIFIRKRGQSPHGRLHINLEEKHGMYF